MAVTFPNLVDPKSNLNPPESEARISGIALDSTGVQLFFNDAPIASKPEGPELRSAARLAGKDLGKSK